VMSQAIGHRAILVLGQGGSLRTAGTTSWDLHKRTRPRPGVAPAPGVEPFASAVPDSGT
jgi:hypothetical protein